MKFVSLTPEHAKEWDEIALDSDDAWMFHLYDWLPLTEEAWKLEPRSFLVESEGRMVGIFPLQKRKGSRILRSTFMGLGGAVIRNGIPEGLRKKILLAMYDHVEEIAHECGCISVEIHLPMLSNASLTSQWHVNPLVHYFYEDISTHTWMVDLTASEDAILNQCSYDARRSIKKAAEAGYRIEKVQSVEDIHTYYEIHCETRHRTGVEPHPEQYFLGQYETLCRKGYATIWKALDQNGEPIAFEVIGLFNKGALYWAGCCRTAHLDSGVNYLLQHHSMIAAKQQGAEWFENGEAFPNIREGKLRGLTVFKGKFGGELHRAYKGRLTSPSDTESEGRRLLKNWLRSTAALLTPALGMKLIGFAVALARRGRRVFQWGTQFLAPSGRIGFIKPYWGMAEFWNGFCYRDRASRDPVGDAVNYFKQTFSVGGSIVPTSSGRTALELALRVLVKESPERTKVIIPTYCCRGVLDPVVKAGLIPLLVDVDVNLNISATAVEAALARNEGVLAIVVPHLGGCAADIREISSMANAKGVVIIEDACQALGKDVVVAPASSGYNMAFFSFGIGKNLMATAGGMLISNILKDRIAVEAGSLGKEDTLTVKRRFRANVLKYFFALKQDTAIYTASAHKYNSMHPLDACLLYHQLRRLRTIIHKRRQHAEKVQAVLRSSDLSCYVPDKENHVYTKCSVVFDDRYDCSRLKTDFMNAGIETEEMYTPLHLRECGAGFALSGDFKVSERLYRNVFNIPVRPSLSREQMRRIMAVIRQCKTLKKSNG